MTGNGLLIDLATPQIKYGDGTKFGIDAQGNLTCRNLINSNGILSLLHFSSVKGPAGYKPEYGHYTTANNSYTNKIIYYADSFKIPVLIPENFTLAKAELLITTEPSVYPVYSGDSYGSGEIREGVDAFPSYVWGKISLPGTSEGAGYCHCTPTMPLSVYAASDDAFQSLSGAGAYSSFFFADYRVDFSTSTKLADLPRQFLDLDVNGYSGSYYGATESVNVDISTGLINYLSSHNTRNCNLAIGPTTMPGDNTFSISERSESTDGGTHYYAIATPKITPYLTNISHTCGIINVEVFLYGYYKTNIND